MVDGNVIRVVSRLLADRRDPADPHSLPEDVVYCLARDGQGRLWVGTFDGLCRYRPDTDDFQRVPHVRSVVNRALPVSESQRM